MLPLGDGKQSLLESCKTKKIELTQYSEAKRASTEFQRAKDELFKAFSKAELGAWVKKPMEQDEFFGSIGSNWKSPYYTFEILTKKQSISSLFLITIVIIIWRIQAQ